jgi:sn-glycerol 3-phosphate transport system substrate-binding protein
MPSLPLARPRSLAALALAGLLAVACGGGDDDGGGGGSADPGGGGDDLPACPVDALEEAAAGGPVEVTFWHAMGGADLEGALVALTDEFNASQDRVHVELLNQQGYEENFESYRTATAADRPAIVQLPDYYLQAMADSGTTIPAQACVEASGFDLDPLVDRVVEYYTLDDVLQTMPFNVSNPVLYFNRAAFEAAGLDPSAPPTTLEELRTASQAIVDSGAATYGIALETGFDSGGGWGIEQWFARAGELYADNDNGRTARATEVLFDNELGVEIFGFLQQMVQDGLAVNVGENSAGTDGLFKLADASEPAAMTLYSSAGISSVLNALEGGLIPGFGPENLGIGPLPAPEGEGGVTVGGAALWLVQDQPDEVIAGAWEYITFLLSAQSQSDWSVGTGYVPVNEGAVELAPLADTFAADPRFRVAYDQLVAGVVNPATAGPVLGPLRQVRGEVAAALQAVLSGGADPADALAAAAEASDALLEDYATRTGTG